MTEDENHPLPPPQRSPFTITSDRRTALAPEIEHHATAHSDANPNQAPDTIVMAEYIYAGSCRYGSRQRTAGSLESKVDNHSKRRST